jgi:hypothetical protein
MSRPRTLITQTQMEYGILYSKATEAANIVSNTYAEHDTILPRNILSLVINEFSRGAFSGSCINLIEQIYQSQSTYKMRLRKNTPEPKPP